MELCKDKINGLEITVTKAAEDRTICVYMSCGLFNSKQITFR